MATLSISLSGSGIVNGSKSWTVSDADIQSLLAAMTAKFSDVLPDSPTNGQILIAWVSGFASDTVSYVSQYKKNIAAQSAIATTPPIVIS